jgi:hypothetical protein
MTAMQKLALFLPAVALAGCAVPYREPAGSNVATVTFRNTTDETGQAFIYGDADECTDRTRLPVMPQHTDALRKVPASTPVSFTMFYVKRQALSERYCQVTLTFVPETGHRYAATLSLSENACHLALSDAGTRAYPFNPPMRVNLAQRNWKRGLTEHGPWCSPAPALRTVLRQTGPGGSVSLDSLMDLMPAEKNPQPQGTP